eukprot:gene4212-4511_t
MTKAKKSIGPAKAPTIMLTREIENQLKDNVPFVIGADEAGRGPLAGPVVAAACYLPPHLPLIDGIGDSKLLSEADREIAFEILTNHPEVVYGVSIVSHTEIDEINILQASLTGMARATQQLLDKLPSHSSFTQISTSQALPSDNSSKKKGKIVKKTKGGEELNEKATTSDDWKSSFIALIDGNRLPTTFPLTNLKPVIQGDRKVYSIAAASIIAKVTRDRIMMEYDKQFPIYNFAQHKGYPTFEHRSIVAQYGPCEIHRRSYGPVKAALLAREKKEDNEAVTLVEKKKRGKTPKITQSKSKRVEEDGKGEDQEVKEQPRKKRSREIISEDEDASNEIHESNDDSHLSSKRRKSAHRDTTSLSERKTKKVKNGTTKKDEATEHLPGIRRSERIKNKPNSHSIL